MPKNQSLCAWILCYMLVFCSIPLAAQDTIHATIPQWLIHSWEMRTQDGGSWVTTNTAYKRTEEPFDAYGLQWTYGLGEMHIKGELYGIQNGQKVASFWQFLEYWDPETGKARILQIGSDGTVGKGYFWRLDDGSIKEWQKFVQPGGGSFLAGHHLWLEQEQQHVQSFTIVNEEWIKRRHYIWTRQASSQLSRKN